MTNILAGEALRQLVALRERVARLEAEVAALREELAAHRRTGEATEECETCGQPFTPVPDSCLCATCTTGLWESNERLYRWQEAEIERLRALLAAGAAPGNEPTEEER